MPDKLDFQTAQTNIKREKDQKLKTYKETLDLEENWQHSKFHAQLVHH